MDELGHIGSSSFDTSYDDDKKLKIQPTQLTEELPEANNTSRNTSGTQEQPREAHMVPGTSGNRPAVPAKATELADASGVWASLPKISALASSLGTEATAIAEAAKQGVKDLAKNHPLADPEKRTEFVKQTILDQAKSLGPNASIEARQAAFHKTLGELSSLQSLADGKQGDSRSSASLDLAAGVLARSNDDQLSKRVDFLLKFKDGLDKSDPQALTQAADTLAKDKGLVADMIDTAAASRGEKLTQEHLDSLTDFVHGNLSQLNPEDRAKLVSGSLDLIKGLDSSSKLDLTQLAAQAQGTFDSLSDEGKKIFANNLVNFATREADLLGIKNFNMDSAAAVVTNLFDKDGKLDQTKLDKLANDISNRILNNPQTKAERDKAEEAEQAVRDGAYQAYSSILNDPKHSPYRYSYDEHGNRHANYSGLEALGISLGLGHDKVWQESYQTAASMKDSGLRERVSSELNQAMSQLNPETSSAIKFARDIIDHSDLKPKTDIRLDDMLALQAVQGDFTTIQQTSETQSLIAAQESNASQDGWQYYNAGSRTDSSGKQIERIYALKGSRATLFERAQGSDAEWTSFERQNQAQAISEINASQGIAALSTDKTGNTNFYSNPQTGPSDEFRATWTDPKEQEEILKTYNMGTIETADGQTLVTAVRKDGSSKPQVLVKNETGKKVWKTLDYDLNSRLAEIKAKTDTEQRTSQRAAVIYQQQSQRYYDQSNYQTTSRTNYRAIGSAAARARAKRGR